MKVTVTTGTLDADLQAVIDLLQGPGLVALYQAMGTEVQAETASHVRDLADERHATADRLGAGYTGFLSQAAEKIESPAALSATADAATLTISHPGFGRAFHDVTITAGDHLIPIALNALAYGHSPLEFTKIALLHRKTGGEKKPEAERKPLDDSIPAWLLVDSVTQRQDRSLLNSDEEWQTAAARGAEKAIVRVMKAKMQSS